MKQIKTSGIVEMVLDEAESQFKTWFVPKSKREELSESLSIIDRLCDEFDCESAEAEVDDETMVLSVALVCPDIVMENGRSHLFFELIKHTDSFAFSAEEDMLRITLNFAGLWRNRD